jgi:hypothetical protein
MHHAEMVIERFHQHLRSFAVALSDNYTERFHEIFLVGLGRKTKMAFAGSASCGVSPQAGGIIS